MGFNVLVDALLGIIPVLGDFFDMAWKVNLRNIKLLDTYAENPREVTTSSRLIVWAVALLLGVLIVLIAVLGFILLRAMWVKITA